MSSNDVSDFLVEVKINGNEITMEVTEEDHVEDGKKEPPDDSSVEDGEMVSLLDFAVKEENQKDLKELVDNQEGSSSVSFKSDSVKESSRPIKKVRKFKISF